MVVYEKIKFEAYINDQYICLKNKIADLYFTHDSTKDRHLNNLFLDTQQN